MASIENIKGSNGSGNANVATVQSTRAPGSTTIVVDTVLDINPAGFMATMGTPHTFTDPVTSETITVISEATAVDFAGHINSGHIEIDTIAPGYTDTNGSAVGDIVIIRPTTQWADNVASLLGVAHRDNGTLAPAIIYDSNGNEQIIFVTTASAVNEVTLTNAATGNSPTLAPTGGDTNITLKIAAKGTGRVELNGAGASDTAYVATAEVRNANSYAAIATAGPAVTVTVGASGRLRVGISCGFNSDGSNNSFMGFSLSGANTLAAADKYSISQFGTNQFNTGGVFLLKGLTAGSTTVTALYKATGGNSTFRDRNLWAEPLN